MSARSGRSAPWATPDGTASSVEGNSPESPQDPTPETDQPVVIEMQSDSGETVSAAVVEAVDLDKTAAILDADDDVDAVLVVESSVLSLFDGAARNQRYAEGPGELEVPAPAVLPAAAPVGGARSSRPKTGRHRWMAAGDAVATYVAAHNRPSDDETHTDATDDR